VNNHHSNKNLALNQSRTRAGGCTPNPTGRSCSSMKSGLIRDEVGRHGAVCHRSGQVRAIDGLVSDRIVELFEHPFTQQLPHRRRRSHDSS
jgi:hypothetical protein